MISILYVDDEESLLEVGKLFLERSGQFSVDIITSAPEALALLDTETYDAIVSDYQMPGMDGIAFLKKVRSSGNTIPFILFTGRGREEVAIQALNQGADFYLQKGGEPVSQFTELEHQIRHAVQQRQAEASIRDHEQREADIINFLPDATFAIDTDGVVIAWNRAIEEMTGVSAAAILGKGDYEYAIPFYGGRQPILIDLIFESDEVISRKYAHIIHEKDTLIADTTHSFPKGKKVTLMGMASPLYNRHGDVVGAIESIRDITERKRTDDAIRESEQRYRNVVEDQIELISRFLPDSTHVFVNEAYCRYFGLKRDDVLGKRFRPNIPAGDRERVKRFFASLTPDHPIDSIEHRIILQDGTVRWQRWSDRAIFDPSGRVTEYQSVGLDITEKKATEAALEESETRFREQYQNNPLAIFTWQHRNGDFFLADYNKAAETLTSGRAHDFFGRSASDLYAHRPELLSEIRKCFSDRTVISKDLVSEHFLPGRLIHTTASFVPPDLIMVHMEDITELRQAEEALRESQERFRAIFDSTFQFTGLLTPEGILIEVNRTALDFVGARLGDVVNRPFWESPWWRGNVARVQRLRDAIHEAAKGRFVRYEEEIEGAGNSRMAVDFSLKPVSDPEGRIRLLIPEARDITEKKQDDKELYESEQCLASIYNTVGDVIFQLTVEPDRQYRFTSVNRAFSRTTGLSYDQVIGRKVDEIIPHESLPMVLQKYQQAIEEKAIVRWEETSGYPSGQLTGEVSIAPIFDKDGNCTHLIGSVHDITERKKAEVALRESEAKYRGIFAAESDGITVVDRETGTIIDCNDALSLMHGYEKGELLGLPLTTLSAETDATRAAITEGTRFIRDRYHKRKDGSVFPVEITVNATNLQGREVLIGAIRNVTEHQRAEEALHQANRSLALLTNVTRHDISNQLVALNGFLELLHEKVRDPALEDYFKWISQVSTRIASMIQFASTYETVRKTEPVWLDIRTLAETAARQVSLGNVTVKNEIPSGTEVFADPLLVKVFYNLVDNAIRYGGKITAIRFSLVDRDGHGIIVCEDNGDGIPPGNKEKIFDRGFGKNTGLGLFLSREILSLTGITIRETGEPGKGARFEIAVPNGAYRFTNVQ